MPRPRRNRSMTRPKAVGFGDWASSGAEGPVERRDPAVHASAIAVLADFGVHHEGEIDRRRTLGQPLHVTPRREHEDLVLIQVDLQELEELLGTVRVLL